MKEQDIKYKKKQFLWIEISFVKFFFSHENVRMGKRLNVLNLLFFKCMNDCVNIHAASSFFEIYIYIPY